MDPGSPINTLQQEMKMLQGKMAELRLNQKKLFTELGAIKDTQNYILEQLVNLQSEDTKHGMDQNLNEDIDGLKHSVTRIQQQIIKVGYMLTSSIESETYEETNGTSPQMENMDRAISSILLNIGVPSHTKSFRYMMEGIKLMVNDPTIINRMTRVFYPELAKTFDTTPKRVEVSIRHAIDVAWKRTGLGFLETMLDFTLLGRKKPSNSEFLSLAVKVVTSEIGLNKI